jgi:1,2-phenylacetyl-CoA epoxidase PaaB subunit
MNNVTEIETSLWTICVGDIFSNVRMPYHLKVVKIEVEDMMKPDDAKIYSIPVHPKNHRRRMKIMDVSEHISYRAWYYNEFWSK